MDIAGRLQNFFAGAQPSAVLAAYLFGSVARGDAHRDSVVDALDDLQAIEEFASIVARAEAAG